MRHSLANYFPDIVDGEVRGFYVRVTDITAAKHAGTHRACLSLAVSAGILSLTVEDAGCGIADLGAALEHSRGFGLTSVRERLLYLGGATEFGAGRQGGLRVALSLPLTGTTKKGNP